MPSSSDLMQFKQQQYYCGITGPTGKTGYTIWIHLRTGTTLQSLKANLVIFRIA